MKITTILATITIAMIASTASAQTLKKGTQAVGDAVKATRGGKAAVGSITGNAAKTLSAGASVLAIMQATTPKTSDVAAFKQQLNAIPSIEPKTVDELGQAFEVTLADSGCLDSGMSSTAYKTFAELTTDGTRELAQNGETVNGLNQMAKYSDLDKNGVVTADEQAASTKANETLTRIAQNMLTKAQKVFGVAKELARSRLQGIGQSCGLNQAIPARL